MRTVLIMVFGAFPATIICLYACFLFLTSVWLMISGVSIGLLLAAWAVAGIVGTVCLWIAAFREVSNKLLVGLIVGGLAILPLTLEFVERYETLKDYAWQLLLTSPLVVVAFLVLDHVASHLNNRSAPSKKVV